MRKRNILLLLLGLLFCFEALCQEGSELKSLLSAYRITPRSGSQNLDISGDWTLGHLDQPVQDLTELSRLKDPFLVKRPTTVQMALFHAGKYPNPYYHLNSKKYEWVDKKVWYYRKRIEVPKSAAQNKLVFLTFDGLDYFARIWFNGRLMGAYEGMFGEASIEVSGLLNASGENDIVVELKAANYGQWDTFNYREPGRIIKSIDQAGGVSSSHFFALGMWKGARVDIVPAIHMERPFLRTESASSEQAEIGLSVEVYADAHSLQYKLHPEGNAILSRGTLNSDIIPLENEGALRVVFTTSSGKQVFDKRFALDLVKGRNWIEEKIVIRNPDLWWPNGLGESPVYRVSLSIEKEGKEQDRIELNYGIRKIETHPTAGRRTEERWDNWQYTVNGRRFFIKGMNWMAADALLDLPDEKYKWLLTLARDAGIQMIRVWGGGLIETDAFYETCDSLGIMVWQDFPVWHQDTPDRPQELWENQVIQNIARLRNHPSLTLYCGGNGFNPYSSGSTVTVGILERSLNNFDPSRPFVRTSSDAGNIHTYPDMDPSWYRTVYRYVPFISETGMHSVPDADLLREIIDNKEFADLGGMYEESFPRNHPEIDHHFVEYNASRVPRMLSRASHIGDMRAPTLESMAEATQIGAGEFYQVLSEGMQSNFPVTAGLMPWVFKRSWPVFSAIMFVDGFGQPSAPYYFLKRTYESTHVSVLLPHLIWAVGETVPVNVAVSHAGATSQNHKISVAIYSDDWKKQWSKEINASLTAGPSVFKESLGEWKISSSFRDRYFFVVAELRDDDGSLVSRSVYWPRALRMLEDSATRQAYLEEPKPYRRNGGREWPYLDKGPWLKPVVSKGRKTRLKVEVLSRVPDAGEVNVLTLRITNSGTVPAFMTSIDIKGSKPLFVATDNFFWMAPGEQKDVAIRISPRSGKYQAADPIEVSAWNANKITVK